mmetsp:Transcript_68228/g.127346  ORF Transcript_68228/g.127346 Transcript_68228/m.127346 type:complete len:255 (+) Transcript_68228:65-829(+)
MRCRDSSVAGVVSPAGFRWRRRASSARLLRKSLRVTAILATAVSLCHLVRQLVAGTSTFVVPQSHPSSTRLARSEVFFRPTTWQHHWQVARHAQSYSGDEFQAARDRIRRIQLGLGPNDPLPPEDGGEEPYMQNVTEEEVTKSNTTETGVLDAVDAYAGTEKDMLELADVEGTPKGAQESGPFKDLGKLPGQLLEDLRIVTTPSMGELAQTFGIVVALVAVYTGFIAVVDLVSQLAFSQVFQEWYVAARPDDSM